MTLEIAQMKLERLLNELQYLENRKEQLMSIVLPKSTSYESERVDGGAMTDKLIKYVELEEKEDIEERIKNIKKEILNIELWINKELDIIKQYGDKTYEVVYLKEIKFITDDRGNRRRLTWNEIAKQMNYTERNVQYIYNRYKNNEKEKQQIS